MILLDYKDSRPIYEQVVDRFKLLILRGVIKQNEKLPSVRNLAVELSLNPNTIQRAYGELERQGYIYTVKGKGNFSSGAEKLIDRYKEEIQRQLKEICETAISIGMTEEELIGNIREWRSL